MALTIQEKMYTSGDWMTGNKQTAGIGAAFTALVLVKGLIGGTRGGGLLRNVVLSGAISAATLQVAGRVLKAKGTHPNRIRPPDYQPADGANPEAILLTPVSSPIRPTEYEVSLPTFDDDEKVYLTLWPCRSKDWKIRVGEYGAFKAALIWDDKIEPTEVKPFMKVKTSDGREGTLYLLHANTNLQNFLDKYAPNED